MSSTKINMPQKKMTSVSNGKQKHVNLPGSIETSQRTVVSDGTDSHIDDVNHKTGLDTNVSPTTLSTPTGSSKKMNTLVPRQRSTRDDLGRNTMIPQVK